MYNIFFVEAQSSYSKGGSDPETR